MGAEYEYQMINISLEPAPDDFRKATIETAANRWAEQGWRTVGVMPSRALGYSDAILIERKKETNPPIAIEVDCEGKSYIFPWEDVRVIVHERK
jgi:hypothetical protein